MSDPLDRDFVTAQAIIFAREFDPDTRHALATALARYGLQRFEAGRRIGLSEAAALIEGRYTPDSPAFPLVVALVRDIRELMP